MKCKYNMVNYQYFKFYYNLAHSTDICAISTKDIKNIID